MAMSADELMKFEITGKLGSLRKFDLRIFTHGSNYDQLPFSDGGLTFGINGVKYGSCDAVWTIKKPWTDPLTKLPVALTPVLALEGTDCLNRKSSGNAQYQRFHHALGAVRGGSLGVYYLRPGKAEVRPELCGMAMFASEVEAGTYIVTQNLEFLEKLLSLEFDSVEWSQLVDEELARQKAVFYNWFEKSYKSDWMQFAKKRSTIVTDDFVIKHAGRMLRNFTDSSQRAGHIAVGEMYLSKYFFGREKKVKYLFPRMTSRDFEELDRTKSNDKEWALLRNEPGVELSSIDDIAGLPLELRKGLLSLASTPLKGKALAAYNSLVEKLTVLLRDESSGVRLN